MMSAAATRFIVRWQCGSSSTPITHFGPDDGAHAFDDVAFDVVVAVRHHGAVQAEQQRRRPAAPP